MKSNLKYIPTRISQIREDLPNDEYFMMKEGKVNLTINNRNFHKNHKLKPIDQFEIFFGGKKLPASLLFGER